MSLQDSLSKINNSSLRSRLIQIASNDGGKNNAEIDTKKGYQELCKLLSGNQYKNDNDILLGLKIDYEANYVNQSNNNIGNVKGNNSGNVIYGSGNAVGGANSTNISGKDNVVITGSNNTVIVNKDNDKNISIPAKDAIRGRTAANKVYDEAVDSWVAFNDRIVSAINDVDAKSAYSFFKEYKDLRGNHPKLFKDIFEDVTDPRNVITNKQVVHLINSLLTQASGIGLENSDAYKELQKYVKSVSVNDDLTGKQPINFDFAVDELLKEMSEYIK